MHRLLPWPIFLLSLIQGQAFPGTDTSDPRQQECTVGRYLNGSFCAPCPVGKYSETDRTWASNCTACPVGRYAPIEGMQKCIECARGNFANTTGLHECIPCPPGRFGSMFGQSYCEACAPGRYIQSAMSSECLHCDRGTFSGNFGLTECEDCPAGSISENGATNCTPCPKGFQSEFNGSVSCTKCEEGFFSNEENTSKCKPCPRGFIANRSGMSGCEECGATWIWPMTSDGGRVQCITDAGVFVGIVCILTGWTCFFCLLPYALRYRAQIDDISLEHVDGVSRVIIRTWHKHWLPTSSWQRKMRRCCRRMREACESKRKGFVSTKTGSLTGTFTINGNIRVTSKGHILPALFSLTDHPYLDDKKHTAADRKKDGWVMTEAAAIHAEAAAFFYWASQNGPGSSSSLGRTTRAERHCIQPLTAHHVMLLTADGKPDNRSIETSKGCLHIPFPVTLWWVSVPGTFISLGGLMGLSLMLALLPFIVLVTAPEGAKWVYVLTELLSAVIAVSFHIVRHCFSPPSPMQRKLGRHAKRLARANPCPEPMPKGPNRAIRAGHVVDVHAAFDDCIRSRDMYYVATNIIKPLTKDSQLSYSEVVGPQQVDWFVSHYWGTSFTHFVFSIKKHSETVVEPPRSAADVSYWICSFSNNQWELEMEMGSSWEESSFYLALLSDHCVGTAMVLDDEAWPLTRAWCLFEVLQTKNIRTKREDFQGLYLCTSTGVLQQGKAGVDVAMRIAERLTKLRLENATASVQKDKEMIDDLVSKMPGGFAAVNRFVRHNIAEALRTMQAAFTSELEMLLYTLDSAEHPTDETPAVSERPHKGEDVLASEHSEAGEEGDLATETSPDGSAARLKVAISL